MEDYKTIMQEILLQYYSPIPGGDVFLWTTPEILTWFQGVIPAEPIDAHDVFDVLQLAGFKHSQKTNEDQTKILVWNLYENT